MKMRLIVLLLTLMHTCICAKAPESKQDTHKKLTQRFQNGARLSTAGDVLCYIGTGLALANFLTEDYTLGIAGAIVFQVGLPLNGAGTLMMRKTASPGSGMRPNGWPWYIGVWGFALLFASTQFYDNETVLYGSIIGSSICSLVTWRRFNTYRGHIKKRFREYVLNVEPVIVVSSGEGRYGLRGRVSF